MYEMHGQLIIVSVTTATQSNLKNLGSPTETVTEPYILKWYYESRQLFLKILKIKLGFFIKISHNKGKIIKNTVIIGHIIFQTINY